MKRIIVIEDDQVLLTMYRIFLTMEGYKAFLYTSGNSFINGNFSIPDLFILDYSLPDGITGLDICREIRKNKYTGATPVIMISSNLISPGRLISAGVNDFLQKPFDTRELALLIQKWLNLTKRERE